MSRRAVQSPAQPSHRLAARVRADASPLSAPRSLITSSVDLAGGLAGALDALGVLADAGAATRPRNRAPIRRLSVSDDA